MSAGGASCCARPSFVQSVQGSPERDIPDDIVCHAPNNNIREQNFKAIVSLGASSPSEGTDNRLHEAVRMEQLSTSPGQQYGHPAIESTVESSVDVSQCVGGVAIHVPVGQSSVERDTACSRGCDDSFAEVLSREDGTVGDMSATLGTLSRVKVSSSRMKSRLASVQSRSLQSTRSKEDLTDCGMLAFMSSSNSIPSQDQPSVMEEDPNTSILSAMVSANSCNVSPSQDVEAYSDRNLPNCVVGMEDSSSAPLPSTLAGGSSHTCTYVPLDTSTSRGLVHTSIHVHVHGQLPHAPLVTEDNVLGGRRGTCETMTTNAEQSAMSHPISEPFQGQSLSAQRTKRIILPPITLPPLSKHGGPK